MELVVKIMKYLGDDPQPGIVECEFADADGKIHTVIDKAFIFLDRLLSEQDSYPLEGAVRCELLAQLRGTDERDLARVRILAESTEGLSEFVVLKRQLR